LNPWARQLQTACISHPDCLKHEMGEGHPECPARPSAIEDQLTASGLLQFLQQRDAPLASFEQLARVHSLQYIEATLASTGESDAAKGSMTVCR